MRSTIMSLLDRIENARKVFSPGHVGGYVFDVSSLSIDEYELLKSVLKAKLVHAPAG